MTELAEGDAGSEHTVDVGEHLVVRLAENRTTGYRWRLSSSSPGLVLADDAYEAPPPGRVGAGGMRTFRLLATAPGTHLVTAALRRSWESGAGDAATLEFPVRVR